MLPTTLMTEEDLRSELARVAIQMRQLQQRRAALDRQWHDLVGDRIELQARLDRFEITKLGYLEGTA